MNANENDYHFDSAINLADGRIEIFMLILFSWARIIFLLDDETATKKIQKVLDFPVLFR